MYTNGTPSINDRIGGYRQEMRAAGKAYVSRVKVIKRCVGMRLMAGNFFAQIPASTTRSITLHLDDDWTGYCVVICVAKVCTLFMTGFGGKLI
jgi:hypothetical protein